MQTATKEPGLTALPPPPEQCRASLYPGCNCAPVCRIKALEEDKDTSFTLKASDAGARTNPQPEKTAGEQTCSFLPSSILCCFNHNRPHAHLKSSTASLPVTGDHQTPQPQSSLDILVNMQNGLLLGDWVTEFGPLRKHLKHGCRHTAPFWTILLTAV